ncbi:hypothetical protein CORC01_01061 [Colletotrichum orchidophilum]|uniref:Uncharacterized protein n=1 Tax=Colletotrichum orchidophilum TaxID=1209926 RepID=A0A1G4BQL6_9PEZI|nr:uncharacterized protein CORC01_01061 [Colletotrichum orchidophilum]OHF03742.1 hypothetical protein CORC01_01061 [Colletotrichum orchidophilum]
MDQGEQPNATSRVAVPRLSARRHMPWGRAAGTEALVIPRGPLPSFRGALLKALPSSVPNWQTPEMKRSLSRRVPNNTPVLPVFPGTGIYLLELAILNFYWLPLKSPYLSFFPNYARLSSQPQFFRSAYAPASSRDIGRANRD